MSAPLKSAEEISLIINRGQHAIADIGLDLVKKSKRGINQSDTKFRDDMYRLVLLRIYLQNILDDDGNVIAYYQDPDNEHKYNKLLDAIARLSQFYGGAAIPLLTGKRIPLYFYPSSGQGSSTPSTGGPAVPGGVTFQNQNVQAPGEIVDSMSAGSSEYAFYIVNVRGTGSGEGSRLDILGVNWRNSEQPVITNYRGNDVGGVTTGVSFSAALVGGNIELTCNVPTDGWIIKGSRISFENISFSNVQGPLPAGGTIGQYLRKLSSNDFDAGFATIIMSEVTGLIAALAEKIARDGSIALTNNLPAGGNKITGLGAGTQAGDSIRYEQVIGVFLQLIGGTMSGPIAMGGNKITGLGTATTNGDAVPFEQLPTIPGSLPPSGPAGGDLAGSYPDPTLAEARVKSVGVQLLQKVLLIGDWNMILTQNVDVAHGLGSNYKKIRTIDVIIRKDTDDDYYKLSISNGDMTAGWVGVINSTNIRLTREAGEFFDDAAFNATGFNRGWVTITYEE